MKRILFTLAVMAMLLTACSGKKYNVDYHGGQDLFKGAKSSYAEGEKVKLLFDMVATDTDYTFYIDGEEVRPEWDSRKHGYIIEFRMPAHDVEIDYDAENSMVYIPSIMEETVEESTELEK